MFNKTDNNLINVLFISPLPPPYYGSAISSEMCLSILNDEKKINVVNIKINYSVELDDVGLFTINKINGFFKVFNQIIKYKRKTPEIIYFVPATEGIALIRDCIFIKFINFNRKSKLIIHLRSQFLNNNFENIFWNFLIKEILRCDIVIILGKELIKNLNGYVEQHKIRILPNAIPNSVSEIKIKNIMDHKIGRDDGIQLLFLSNMMESKGWFKVLQSCNILKKSKIKFICHFVGAWHTVKDEKLFHKYICENDLENYIIYDGRLIGEQKNNVLSKTDILIFPTDYKLETFGRVIIEGMEFGIPVIANNIGSIPSIIEHGKTGYILDENTPERICYFISKLLNENLRIEMGYNARVRFLNEYTLEKYKYKFLDLFI